MIHVSGELPMDHRNESS